MASKKGFERLTEMERKAVSSKGGKSAHKKGTAHEWDSEEGKRAGQLKGGAKLGTDIDVMDEDIY